MWTCPKCGKGYQQSNCEDCGWGENLASLVGSSANELVLVYVVPLILMLMMFVLLHGLGDKFIHPYFLSYFFWVDLLLMDGIPFGTGLWILAKKKIGSRAILTYCLVMIPFLASVAILLFAPVLLLILAMFFGGGKM